MSPESPSPTPPPVRRRLRLSMIVAQLRDDALKKDAALLAASGANPPGDHSDPAGEVGSVAAQTDAGPGITIGEIVDRARDAGFGFIIAFLAICSIPIPGTSVVFGTMIMFGALQMLCGLHRPWLPKWIRRRAVSAAALDKVARLLTRWTGWLEVIVRPRFEFMLRGPGWVVIALAILVLAAGLALPLPIPWSNTIFTAPLLLYAIAMLESDGLLVMLGHAVVLAQINLVVRLWDVIWSALWDVLAWMGFGG